MSIRAQEIKKICSTRKQEYKLEKFDLNKDLFIFKPGFYNKGKITDLTPTLTDAWGFSKTKIREDSKYEWMGDALNPKNKISYLYTILAFDNVKQQHQLEQSMNWDIDDLQNQTIQQYAVKFGKCNGVSRVAQYRTSLKNQEQTRKDVLNDLFVQYYYANQQQIYSFIFFRKGAEDHILTLEHMYQKSYLKTLDC